MMPRFRQAFQTSRANPGRRAAFAADRPRSSSITNTREAGPPTPAARSTRPYRDQAVPQPLDQPGQPGAGTHHRRSACPHLLDDPPPVTIRSLGRFEVPVCGASVPVQEVPPAPRHHCRRWPTTTAPIRTAPRAARRPTGSAPWPRRRVPGPGKGSIIITTHRPVWVRGRVVRPLRPEPLVEPTSADHQECNSTTASIRPCRAGTEIDRQ